MAAAAQLLHQTSGEKQPLSEGVALSDFSPRRAVWDARKGQAEEVANLYDLAAEKDLRKHGENVHRCSDVLQLVGRVKPETGELGYKAESWKCRERHCPVCQSVRAKRLQNEFIAALPVTMEQVPNGVFLLLTLTIRNCPLTELRKTLADMGKAWKRLLRFPEFKIVKGWVRGTEVTRSANGEAHPHYHVLLLVPPYYFAGKSYIKQACWVELWQAAARLDYTPSVDIRRVKVAQSGLQEAIKAATYSVKPAELTDDPAWFLEFHKQVSSLRFLATGGVIKTALSKTATDKRKSDDIAEGEDPQGEAERVHVFDWRQLERRYRYSRTINR